MQSAQDYRDVDLAPTPVKQLHRALNGRWHKQALMAFMVIIVGHLMEHILQAIQIFVLGWPRPQALGALGMFFPWLITSEWLHYIYAFLMLVGLYLLRLPFDGRAGTWWNIALVIQFWHHFEHALLLSQAISRHNLFGSPVPMSVLQLFFPRVELHLFYNAVVLVPMLIALYYHRRAPSESTGAPICNCTHPPRREMAMG